MKKRFITSVLAAIIYTAIYAGIITWQEQELREVDLLVGAIIFTITFYLVRTLLDKRRRKSKVTPNNK